MDLTKATALALENPFCIRAEVDGTLLARQGSMVAYRGELSIRTKSEGVRKLIKRTVTKQGLPLMEVEGRGRIWLADRARNVMVVRGEELTMTGRNILAFESTLEYAVTMFKGAGMSTGIASTTFRGTGAVAITSYGQPVELQVTPDSPVWVDTDAVIGWTSSLHAGIHRSEGMKSLLKGGSGEMFQVRLDGTGTVLVQPSESPPSGEKEKGIADAIGDWL